MKGAEFRPTRVRHQDIDRAVQARGAFDLRRKRAFIGDIRNAIGGSLALAHRILERSLAAADHRDGGAGLRQRCGNGAADAASAAGHHCVPSR